MLLTRITPLLLVFTSVSCTPPDQDSVVDDLDATISSSDPDQVSISAEPERQLKLKIAPQKQFPSKSDPFEASQPKLKGDVLQLDVSYGGGCEDHFFTAYSTGKFDDASPVNIDLFISHDANNDSCEAYLSEQLEIDLSTIKEAFLVTYPDAESRVMNIRIKNQKMMITYQF